MPVALLKHNPPPEALLFDQIAAELEDASAFVAPAKRITLMQVSWIDPDDLRSLLGQLQQPASPVKAASVELHTLPNENGFGAREMGIDDGDLWLPEDFAAPAAVTNENNAACSTIRGAFLRSTRRARERANHGANAGD